MSLEGKRFASRAVSEGVNWKFWLGLLVMILLTNLLGMAIVHLGYWLLGRHPWIP